jgi:hypothetical protein
MVFNGDQGFPANGLGLFVESVIDDNDFAEEFLASQRRKQVTQWGRSSISRDHANNGYCICAHGGNHAKAGHEMPANSPRQAAIFRFTGRAKA